MDNDGKRPSAALINREWFESAERVLDGADLRWVVISAVRYVLYGKEPTGLPEKAALVFAMIRSALDSDIMKYTERCARNAANARRGQNPVVASGTQSQPVAANTTPTPTTTPTTTPISLRDSKSEKDIEVEKWMVFGYFWSTGSKNVREELNAFWSYYESLGWKNNKGAAIISKIACARMWRRQFETGAAPNGADAWYAAVKECTIPDYSVWQVFAGAERTENGAVVRLRCGDKYLADLKNAVPTLDRTLQAAWRVHAVAFETISA